MFAVAVENDFDFLSAEYDALFRSSGATAFQHPLWLAQLYARLLPAIGARPLIVVVRRSADRQPVLVLPLLLRHHGGLRVVEFADLKVSDYAAPVCEEATFAQILRDATATRQIRAALRPFDLLRIPKLRTDAPRLDQLLGTQPPRSMGTNTYAAELSGDFASWRAAHMNGSMCRELDKKLRQLHRKGDLRFACSTDATAIRATFDAMRQYRKPRFSGRDGEDLLQSPFHFDFYLATALAGGGAFTRTYTMTMDGRPIAGVVGLSHKDTFLVILGGFDYTTYKNQSLGLQMFEHVARDCLERGYRLLDLTIGDEAYKLSLGAAPTPMLQIARSGSVAGLAAGLVVDRVPGAKALVKRLLPAQPAPVASDNGHAPEAKAAGSAR